ncbi:MAG: bifunctional ornithine acetyltransferase/N-acetylglutamate synthase [Clostridia bacterium]|nr:bifunctional ornithine acetyltransferase/N-acetylglutamate synthase [Clostridia bacterium]
MKQTDGGVTAAQGFKAFGLRAGIKPGKTNKDMAMVWSDTPAAYAAVFTTNKVKAAPVLWDKEIADKGNTVRAIVINSGIANACTGEQGKKDTETTALLAADALSVSKEEVLVASTGVIGAPLPMDVIEKGIKELSGKLQSDIESGTLAAEAIMTTDTKKKEIAVEFELGGKRVTMGGMCKGSGMIHPNMGTMLAFVTTDAAISADLLKKALKEDVKDTFNMVSVDGDTSTNDTLMVLANGCAKNAPVTAEGEDFETFKKALHFINEYLAKRIAEDGEGATRLFETTVLNAKTKEDARILARSVISSNLTKAAIFGKDANWGRILCALGYSGGDFVPDKTDVTIKSDKGEIQLVAGGMAASYSEDVASEILGADAVTAVIDVHDGDFSATAWGCDLTFDYVTINADYRS